MPVYIYYCSHCNKTKEILHSMEFVGNEDDLPQEIKSEITCEGKLWRRIPQDPNVKIGAFGADAKEQAKRREDHMNRLTDNYWMDERS